MMRKVYGNVKGMKKDQEKGGVEDRATGEGYWKWCRVVTETIEKGCKKTEGGRTYGGQKKKRK